MHRVVLAFLVVGIALGCASEPRSDPARMQAIEAQVWSPYCPGRLLKECTTRQAQDLREEISARIDRGQTDAEIFAWVESEFGSSALARPADSGIGVAMWLVPLFIFAIGAGLVFRFVSRSVERSSDKHEEDQSAGT